MIRAFALLILLAAPGAAFAGTFTPPPGCTGFLTVQSRGCRVSNHYICSQDTPGDQWRADFDQDGVYFVSRIDGEGQWLVTLDLVLGTQQTLAPSPRDPASFTELLGGSDTYDFGLKMNDGSGSKVRGFDRLTGKTVVIDGVTLSETAFEYTETDLGGKMMHRSRGHEYISPKWRLFFSGPSEWDDGSGFALIDGSPVQFVLPGEKGFFSAEPLFDCNAVLSTYRPGVTNGN